MLQIRVCIGVDREFILQDMVNMLIKAKLEYTIKIIIIFELGFVIYR